jgi:hypothetical protein
MDTRKKNLPIPNLLDMSLLTIQANKYARESDQERMDAKKKRSRSNWIPILVGYE